MSKFWLSVVGLAVAASMSVLHPAGSAEAAPGSSAGTAAEHGTASLPKCHKYTVSKPWGAVKGQYCSQGQTSEGKGTVQDKQDDGKCVWVHMRFQFADGGSLDWDSPKACGKGKEVSFKKRTSTKVVSAQVKLVRG
jgi:hypothetical protein